MASFKMMSSSTSRNSDLSRRISSSASSSPSVRSNHLRRDPHNANADHSRISFGYVEVHDYNNNASASNSMDVVDRNSVNNGKSVDDVWREIVSGENKNKKTVVMKEEAQEEEYMMTLEDFLAKAEEIDGNDDEIDVKIQPGTFDYPMMGGSGSMRRKRVVMVEEMDKAAAQRQKRMIKNRESAARSRERKQAYQVELETLAAKLERENEQLLREIEEKTRERYRNLMEQLIPVDDESKRRVVPSSSSFRSLNRSNSLDW